MRKQTVRYGLCWLLAASLLLGSSALAGTEELSGSVVAGAETSIIAPFGGVVESIDLKPGQMIRSGDVLVTIQTTRVVAAADGTVRGLYAKVGDHVSSTVLTIAPVSKFTITASVEDAYNAVENRYVTIGEKVYIRCEQDGSHVAVGVVVGADGINYTVETTGGELYLEEIVNIYRDPGYVFKSWIGSGTVARTETIDVTGSGSIVGLYVEDGEQVERGQLLFETVEGALDGYTASGNQIIAAQDGIIDTVAVGTGSKLTKGATLVTLYPLDSFQLAVTVPEDMITSIHEGDVLSFYLDWDEETPRRYQGIVTELSYISTAAAGDTTTFTAYAAFEADDSVRLGMTAVVELEVP